MLNQNLPGVVHLQGADRVALARQATEQHGSQVVVLDDAFQHRRLERDLDIVLIDATEPWGYGRLFPRGLLREPPSALGRAGLVLLTRCDQVNRTVVERIRSEVRRWADVPIVESIHAPLRLVNVAGMNQPVENLEGRPVAAFCGIGNPAAFQGTLARLGCEVVAWRTFPDHHAYSRDDIARLRSWAEQQPSDGVVVTTQKDLVKLRRTELAGRPLWAVQIALGITNGQDLLDRKLKGVLS